LASDDVRGYQRYGNGLLDLLILQFPFLPATFQAATAVAVLGDLLVAAPPAGPGGDCGGGGRWARGGPEEADEEAAHFGDGDGAVERAGGSTGPPLWRAATVR